MTNITVATFAEGVKVVQTEPLHQYDYGQILRFVGIDDAMDSSDNYEVHFSNSDLSGSAKAVVGGTSGVIIPDEYLASGADIHAWVYTHTGASDEDEEYTDGRTSYEVIIPVLKRARPSDLPPTPTGRDTIVGSINGITGDIGDLTPRVETLEGKTAAQSVISDGGRRVTEFTASDVRSRDAYFISGNTDMSGEARMMLQTSGRCGRLSATSSSNILGLYDDTAEKTGGTGNWVFMSESNGDVAIPHILLTGNYAKTSGYPPVLGEYTNGSRVGHTATASSTLSITGQWGTAGAAFSGRSISVPAGSDRRLKTNIRPTDKSGLDLINALDIVQFDWKDGSGHWDFGIIAQDAGKLDENIPAGEETEDTYLTLNLMYLIDILLKAVQELSAEVELLKAKLEDRGVVD